MLGTAGRRLGDFQPCDPSERMRGVGYDVPNQRASALHPGWPAF